MKYLLIVVVSLPMFSAAQSDRRSPFASNLSWQQVREQARHENKYIFLDCFATWCGPCKLMDSMVYPSAEVKASLADRFISVRVQYDRTSHDDTNTRSWYGDADDIMKRYKVGAFPTFLFFSPDGRLVHRGMGGLSVDAFLSLLADATNPKKQYYTYLDEYWAGVRDYSVMGDMAMLAKDLGDRDTAAMLAADYVDDYLYALDSGRLYTKKNMNYILDVAEMLPAGERYFGLLYPDGSRFDQAIGFKISEPLVCTIINRELIKPAVEARGSSVRWRDLQRAVGKKYAKKYADRAILYAERDWYHAMTERDSSMWGRYIDLELQVIDRYEQDSTQGADISHFIFAYNDVLRHGTDPRQLAASVQMMEGIIRRQPGAMTYSGYANLLYKLGERDRALEWQKRCVRLGDALGKVNPGDVGDLEKMKKGIPTWVN